MGSTPQLDAIIKAYCPRCRRGEVFNGPVYGLSFQKMNDVCPKCGLRFEVEPGYFYAAMYVSYAFNVAQIITVGVATFYLSGGSDSPWLYIGVIFAAIFLCAPFNFRYSRVILLHWLSPKVKYNSHYDK